MKLANLGLPGTIHKLPPLDPEIKKILKEYCADFDKALGAGKQRLTNPSINQHCACPHCGSVSCFPLYGGIMLFLCARCKKAYNLPSS